MASAKGPNPSIITVDCHYMGPRRCSAYLILEGDTAVFVDNNTKRAVPKLLAALRQCGYTPEQVSYAIVTHCHLDHAAGSATLLKVCPNAKLVAHPKAARHLAEPSRLIAGAKMVYGDAAYEEQFGVVEPCATDRILKMEDGDTLSVGSRTLTFIHTLGHASHHMCIHDSGTGDIFAGDNFGMIYEDLQRTPKPYCFCVATPVEFDPAASLVSLQQIIDTGAKWAYVGHYGPHKITKARVAQLKRTLERSEAIIAEAVESGLRDTALHVFVAKRVKKVTEEELEACGLAPSPKVIKWVGPDIALNTSGILAAAVQRMGPG